jgi:tRNA pseudouridine55 synthase
LSGVLVMNKPAGCTSFDVVRRVRAMIGVSRVGHTGTLDPLATGVLALCLGQATKVAGFLTEGSKSYEAVIRLGVETDSYDAAGKVTAEASVPPLTAPRLEAAFAKFRGESLQTPPMFSAVKIGGKRLYELARAGKEIARPARPVTVHELTLRDFTAAELRILVKCSKGFFVRALAHDIGKELGCGAHLLSLTRTASGPFTLAQSMTLDQLASLCNAGADQALAELQKHVIPVDQALIDLPAVHVSEADAARVMRGIPIELPPLPNRVRIVGPQGRLLAIAEPGADRRPRYCRVLA